MTHQLHQHPCAYIVTIRFETDDIDFAQERYRIEASDPCEAERLGRARARDSVYHDERIPGLGLVAQVEEAGPHEPDDDPDHDPGGTPGALASGAPGRSGRRRSSRALCRMSRVPGFTYSRWRHGGWYVHGILYPGGAIGCVSRNYADRRWRIVCDPRPFNERPTFRRRGDAALAEWHLADAERQSGAGFCTA